MWNRQFASFTPTGRAPIALGSPPDLGLHEKPKTTHGVCACKFFGLGQQCAVPTQGVSASDNGGDGGGLPDLGAGDTVGTIAIVGGLGVLGLWLGGVL